MTIVLILFGLPAALYGAAWLGAWRAARSGTVPAFAGGAPGPDAPVEAPARWLLPAALLLHGASLAWPWDRGGLHFGFAKALSATLWVGLAATDGGLFFGGGADLLIAQITGIAAVAAWVAVSSGVLFGILRATGNLRVSEREEVEGLDVHEHGFPGYPELAGK